MKTTSLLSFFICISFSIQAQYDAEILTLDFPDEMNPSENYQLDLTFKNTGESELNRSTCTLKVSYISGPNSEAGEDLTIEKDLTVNVSPGDQYTYRWTVEAPIIPGDYKMNVALLNGSKTLDEEEVTTTVEESYNSTIKFAYPNPIQPEVRYAPLNATVRNSGKAQWPEGKYELIGKMVTPPSDASIDDITAFEFEEEIDLSNLAPGNSKFHRFEDYFEAPSTGGTYRVKVTLHLDGKPFKVDNGELNLNPSVLVEDQKADIQEKLTKKIYPNETYPVSFTIKNSGKVNWDKGNYSLKSTVAKRSSSYIDKKPFETTVKINAVEMAPGKSVTVKFPDIKTPEMAGTVEVKYEILLGGKSTEIEGAEKTIKYEIVEVTPDPKQFAQNEKAPTTNEKPKTTIKENVTTKIYPEKSYPISFTIKNSGKIKWEKGDYSLKATVTRKPSSVDDNIFEHTVKFNGSEMSPGKVATLKFPEINTPDAPGVVEVSYEILKNGKPTQIEDATRKIRYEIVELLPELNIGRITLEDDMVSGKTYKLKLDIKNYGDISASRNDWEVKCKTRTIKPSNYRPPRGTFDFSLDGIDMKAKETKYINGSIKAPKVDQETSIRLEFEVYYKGDKMGGPKTFDIKIKS